MLAYNTNGLNKKRHDKSRMKCFISVFKATLGKLLLHFSIIN